MEPSFACRVVESATVRHSSRRSSSLRTIVIRSSIEVLPGGLEEWTQVTQESPFILEAGHLGVPQKVLYKLYMAAMSLYKNANKSAISALSSVILLANPAHQTVLNARKKLMSEGLIDADRELALVALFIGSSKDCAKQSAIWDHRRWIFRRRYEHIGNSVLGLPAEPQGWGRKASVVPMIPLDVLKKECGLIRSACELYPRNYHAWTHYRWVLDLVSVFISSSVESPEVTQEDSVSFLQGEFVKLREWVSRHVSDYSAIHLLCSLATQLTAFGSATLADELSQHALELVLAYPSYEALWLYLRNTLSLCCSEFIRGAVDRLQSREDIPIDVIQKYRLDRMYHVTI